MADPKITARIETTKGEKVVMRVLCDPDTTDGDLAVLLEDAVMDLRWNVMREAETHFHPAGAGSLCSPCKT